MRYFITFACYGTHLHGAESGSVDRRHRLAGSRLLEFRPKLEDAEHKLMDQPTYHLDHESRRVVLEAIHEVCMHGKWTLLAAHVRTNHVHVVLEGDGQPEKMMNAFKAYASRALNGIEPNRKRWARHGSTKWLWKNADVDSAIRYVVEEQGEPMAVFEADPTMTTA